MDLPDGIDPEFAANSLMGLIVTHSTLLPALSGTEPGQPEELAQRISDLFLRAIATDEG